LTVSKILTFGAQTYR